ncbi:MAG TPA: hypothetical protein VFO39_23020 [Candidatus Sulfotelmatobacter sp.]|nr:hypothetical protein [Candidatus Sulfotelmatobacter sp.]
MAKPAKLHPGITMHKLTVGGGFEGLVFTVGSALIFLFGLPMLWYFVAGSVLLGFAVAVLFGLKNRWRSKQKPLSIIMAADNAQNPLGNMRAPRSFSIEPCQLPAAT